MATRVITRIDRAAVRRLTSTPGSPVDRLVRTVTYDTRAVAAAGAPHDTGALATSLRTRFTYAPGLITGYVYSALPYALYVHQGTGIHGPVGRPIRPRRAKVLAFPSRRTGGTVFARQVQGQRPNPFLLEALRAASPWPVDDTVLYN